MITSKRPHRGTCPTHLLLCYDAEPVVFQYIDEYEGNSDEAENDSSTYTVLPILLFVEVIAIGIGLLSLLLTFSSNYFIRLSCMTLVYNSSLALGHRSASTNMQKIHLDWQ